MPPVSWQLSTHCARAVATLSPVQSTLKRATPAVRVHALACCAMLRERPAECGTGNRSPPVLDPRFRRRKPAVIGARWSSHHALYGSFDLCARSHWQTSLASATPPNFASPNDFIALSIQSALTGASGLPSGGKHPYFQESIATVFRGHEIGRVRDKSACKAVIRVVRAKGLVGIISSTQVA